MTKLIHNPFGTRTNFKTNEGEFQVYALEKLEDAGFKQISQMPFSLKVLLESVIRNCDGTIVTEKDIQNISEWNAENPGSKEVPYFPARVILQDFTGVPAVVDLAAMRSTIKRLNGDPSLINPAVPVDLVIDHSVQADVFGTPLALRRNAEIEFQRNQERYKFLRWGQKAFDGFRVVPPATGIIHQVNLEYLAQVVTSREIGDQAFLFPDSVVGTDSHTTMINGLGVLGWGVGGIEAEAGMLGQPSYLIMPKVIGFKLHGRLREGVTATDLVLTVTEMLRAKGVVEQFVEFYGTGLSEITLADRATVANMAPEYGATIGFFPVDDETIRYLKRTGRSEAQVSRVDAYTKMQGLFRTNETPDPTFSETLELELDSVEPSLAGPKRPQDRISLHNVKSSFREALTAPSTERGFGLSSHELAHTATAVVGDTSENVGHGSVVIAAITSCTNTSNPSVMLSAGLLAKNAVDRGLKVSPHIKTSLAPGSKVVTEYLQEANLLPSLADLGFHLVGYGCTTCIGNSGPLPEPIANAISEGELVAAAVLSGNRNFEGRVHPLVRANYLASPPLVVAYALAGSIDVDLTNEPLGRDTEGSLVYLKDIWPSQQEVQDAMDAAVQPNMFKKMYKNVWDGNEEWNKITFSEDELYNWDATSTYVQEPPFFTDLSQELPSINNLEQARVLALLGDSVTTDHISPAGDIPNDSPAGQYLSQHGLEKKDFNSYGSRRGNDRVMLRGTFANIRIKNMLLPGVEGGFTIHFPTGKQMSIYDAAMSYKNEGTALIVIAGKEYGTGSSRDWAAKGTMLMGVKAVIAESYERIHRSNLVGMGVLPLQFLDGESAQSLGIDGQETFDIVGLTEEIKPQQELPVTATKPDGRILRFKVLTRLDSNVDIVYFKNGGILHTVLRNLLH